MAKRPGAGQQQNQLHFGLTYRPAPESRAQVQRFIKQKAAQLHNLGTPANPDRPRTPVAGDNQNEPMAGPRGGN